MAYKVKTSLKTARELYCEKHNIDLKDLSMNDFYDLIQKTTTHKINRTTSANWERGDVPKAYAIWYEIAEMCGCEVNELINAEKIK